MVRPMPVRGSAGKYTSQSGMSFTSDIGSGWTGILQSRTVCSMACLEPWNSSGVDTRHCARPPYATTSRLRARLSGQRRTTIPTSEVSSSSLDSRARAPSLRVSPVRYVFHQLVHSSVQFRSVVYVFNLCLRAVELQFCLSPSGSSLRLRHPFSRASACLSFVLSTPRTLYFIVSIVPTRRPPPASYPLASASLRSLLSPSRSQPVSLSDSPR